MKDIIVVGGGPAGMMAAVSAASSGCKVLLLEKNEKLGKKMFITGKGRCNITNACPTEDFFSNVVHNPKFLMSAVYSFPSDTLIQKLNEYGLQTKIERGQRVFPESDKSSDVIKCMGKMLSARNVEIRLNTSVANIKKNEDGFLLISGEQSYDAKAIIIATGGASYSQTGSTGDGYKFAQSFGHSVSGPYPALSALIENGNTCASLQGLTLKNVQFSLFQNEKLVFSELGEMLFTHEGVSGPLVLSASSAINYEKPFRLNASIDLKPALTPEKLDARILRDFEENKNKQLRNVLTDLLPHRLIDSVLQKSVLDGAKQVNNITKAEREMLGSTLKSFKIDLQGVSPLEEAIVTRGGVSVRDIDPSTMQSKKIPGLYFAGEVIDVDALTGGFNMQIAFSTGYLAGISACKHCS